MADLVSLKILVLLLALHKFGSCSEKCETPHRVTFEKVFGKELPVLEHRATVSIVSAHNSSFFQCNELCATDPQCTAYSIDYDRQECYMSISNQTDDVSKNEIVKNFENLPGKFYFRKRCLRGPKCKKEWSFTVIPGLSTRGESETKRVIRNIESRTECQESCFVETRYNCRSAIYVPSKKICILDSKSIQTFPKNYISVAVHDEKFGFYMENTCVKESKKCDFHAGYVKDKLFTEKIYWNVDKQRCEEFCLKEESFVCTGYAYNSLENQCKLTSKYIAEDVSKVPTSSRTRMIYFKARCSEVVMKCDASTMTAVVTVEPGFKGRIYAVSSPYACFAVTSYAKQDEIFLTMPLFSKQCGTKDMGNGTFGNSIIIQDHPHVLRKTDKKIDIYCDYKVMKQKLRAGKQVFESSDVTEIQSTVTGVVLTPKIRLKIVNSLDEEVTGVKLGEELKLKVEIVDEKSVYGIFGSRLVAKSGNSEDEIPLIDEKGCPIEPGVFPPLDMDPTRKALSSSFQAFKFATDTLVKFELTVSFCLDKCLPVDCDAANEIDAGLKSYGKRRKRHAGKNFVTDVRMQKTLLVISDVKKGNENPYTGREFIDARPTDFPAAENDPGSNPAEGICLTKSILYTFVTIVTILQVLMIIGCILTVFYPKSTKEEEIITSGSNPTPSNSFSSYKKLLKYGRG